MTVSALNRAALWRAGQEEQRSKLGSELCTRLDRAGASRRAIRAGCFFVFYMLAVNVRPRFLSLAKKEFRAKNSGQ